MIRRAILSLAMVLASCNLTKESHSMPRETADPALYRVEAMARVENCLDARLAPATARSSDAFEGRICSENSVRMLELADQRGGLVSLSSGGTAGEEPVILPVTIGFSVEQSGEEADAELYFVEPRPALVRAPKSDSELIGMLQNAEKNGQGVILALKDGMIATDAIVIDAAKAGQLLGFTQ